MPNILPVLSLLIFGYISRKLLANYHVARLLNKMQSVEIVENLIGGVCAIPTGLVYPKRDKNNRIGNPENTFLGLYGVRGAHISL